MAHALFTAQSIRQALAGVQSTPWLQLFDPQWTSQGIPGGQATRPAHVPVVAQSSTHQPASQPPPLQAARQFVWLAARPAPSNGSSAKAFGLRVTKDFPANPAAWSAFGNALTADRDAAGAKTAYDTAKKLN